MIDLAPTSPVLNHSHCNGVGEHEESTERPHSPQFEPLVQLPLVPVNTCEEDEDDIINLRAKMFRFDKAEEPPEWKERGVGYVKILQHKVTKRTRVLMRRDKTLKVCANHFIKPWMELSCHMGSDKTWMWSVQADFADEEPKQELLAIRFANPENAKLFKEKFDHCRSNCAPEDDDVSDHDSGTEEDAEDRISAEDKQEVSDLTEQLTQVTIEAGSESAAVNSPEESAAADGNSPETPVVEGSESPAENSPAATGEEKISSEPASDAGSVAGEEKSST